MVKNKIAISIIMGEVYKTQTIITFSLSIITFVLKSIEKIVEYFYSLMPS